MPAHTTSCDISDERCNFHTQYLLKSGEFYGIHINTRSLWLLGITSHSSSCFNCFFGAKKLPELARSLGKASKEFKAGADEVKREIEDAASSVEDES